jgi:hypothetical protein
MTALEAKHLSAWADLVLSCPFPDWYDADTWYTAMAVLLFERGPA